MSSSKTTRARATQEKLSEDEAYAVGIEAYHYFYPLITMEITRQQATNREPGQKPGCGPANLFSHMRAYPDADFKLVVRPNFDTLYSVAWLDLTSEPMIVSVPDTGGRYYLMPMLDMWTDVFASPGWRTTGTGARNFAVLPPSFAASVPEEAETIHAPTPYVWVVGRTLTDGPEDYPAVHRIQDGYTITPLSQWKKAPLATVAKIDPDVDMKTPPMEQVNNMSAAEYFARAAALLSLHRPHITDWSILARLRRLGMAEGQPFNIDEVDPKIKQSVERGYADALRVMYKKVKLMGRPVNGWQMNTDTMGVYGNHYLKRAIVALIGLGANQPEDAVYPLNFADADGKALNGDNSYVLSFSKSELPPVDAFWSLTLYDQDGFQCANKINRFSLSSWMPLKKNQDGSVDLYIQHDSPGPQKESNWLPAPRGPIGLTMRLYAPRAEAINGSWNPPPVKAVK